MCLVADFETRLLGRAREALCPAHDIQRFFRCAHRPARSPRRVLSPALRLHASSRLPPRYGYPGARCVLSLTVSLRPPVATPEIVAEFVAHEGALCGYRVELLDAEQYHLCYLVFDVAKEDAPADEPPS